MKRGPAILAAGAACSAALWIAQPGHARADSASTTTAGDAAEAWYQTAPVDPCSSPIGCPPVTAPSPFPSGTLHVAAAGGTQTAATYVQPDLSGIPTGQQAISGTMILPLSTVNGNGNANTSAATIVACLATARIPDGTQGSTSAPPSSDCNTKASITPGSNSFTLDLGPFLDAWNSGTPDYGIALLADTANSSSQGAPWSVAFNGRDLAGVPHISSTLTLAPSAGAGAGQTGTGSGFPTGSDFGQAAGPTPTGALPATVPASGIASGLSPVGATPPENPSLAPPSNPARSGSSPSRQTTGGGTNQLALAGASRGFQYPEVMLLPLLFAAGLVFVLRLLTTDATPRANRRRTA